MQKIAKNRNKIAIIKKKKRNFAKEITA